MRNILLNAPGGWSWHNYISLPGLSQHEKITVKAPRLVTHYRKFNNAHREANDFYDLAARGLGDKLGCVLFQLHPAMEYSESNLENILSTLVPAFNNVLEFRHESWWRREVYRMLRQHNISFSGISYPGLPGAVIRSVPVLYYRFHGVPERYASSYSAGSLEEVADAVKSFRGVKDAYIYFNNDIHGAAITNARDFHRIISA